jgi:hypothetical protein
MQRPPNGKAYPRAFKDMVVQETIEALRHGVTPKTIAAKYGIATFTVRQWVRYNPQAYENRLYAISNSLAGQDKRTAFWRRMRLERLSLYREINGLGPNPPAPRKVTRVVD